MLKSFDETERPTEWLRRLENRSLSYEDLVQESGGLALAAYRVARARCMVGRVGVSVPTVRELGAAASEIVAHSRASGTRLEPTHLARECEDAGLDVITPIAPGVARVA